MEEGEAPVSVNSINKRLPEIFKLSQNYPNPFNPITTISYQIPENSPVTLKIYNLAGREIATLINENQSVGIYTVEWNAEGLPSGMYIYQLKAGSFSQTRKLIQQKYHAWKGK